MRSLKRSLPVASALLLLTLTILLTPPSLHPIPAAHAANRTISLVGNYNGWNYSSNANPTITVNPRDVVMISLTSTDTTHQFALDLDQDGTKLTSGTCPTNDMCSSSFSTSSSTTVSITVSFGIGTYKYFCTYHSSSMVGNFVVQAPSTPDFAVSASPNSLSVAQGATGSTMITLTSQGGFSGNVNLAATITPASSAPSVSVTPYTVQVPSASSGTATLTVSAVGGAYTSVSNGNYSVNVTATSGSHTHSIAIQVTVGSTTSSPTGSLNIPPSVLAGIVIAVVAVIALTVFLVRRRGTT